jgi:hypothetical protein
MKLPQWEKRLRQLGNTVKPSAYSRFVIFTGAAVAAGLLAASWLLTYLAPFSESTFQYVSYLRMGKCCIESALASLASMLAAAAIGEAAIRQSGD